MIQGCQSIRAGCLTQRRSSGEPLHSSEGTSASTLTLFAVGVTVRRRLILVTDVAPMTSDVDAAAAVRCGLAASRLVTTLVTRPDGEPPREHRTAIALASDNRGVAGAVDGHTKIAALAMLVEEGVEVRQDAHGATMAREVSQSCRLRHDKVIHRCPPESTGCPPLDPNSVTGSEATPASA